MNNPGKRFEQDFSSSVSSDCMLHRLKDSAQSYNNSKMTKFAWDNPCDFFLYKKPYFYAIECKSTKYKSMSFQKEEADKASKMIKYHQIKSLKNLSKYDGVSAGFLLNFRDEENNIQRTYFQDIELFLDMLEAIDKGSFNEIDLICNGAIKVNGSKKRVRYSWDVSELLDNIDKRVVDSQSI